MNSRVILLASALSFAPCALADHRGDGDESPLAAAAHSLGSAAYEFSQTLRVFGASPRLVEGAAGLSFAVEQFEAEIPADSEDLAQDFDEIESRFEQVRADVARSRDVQGNLQLRNVWLEVEASNFGLRRAWNDLPGTNNGPGLHRGFACTARNARGQLFHGEGWNIDTASGAALGYCQAQSLFCRVLGCAPN